MPMRALSVEEVNFSRLLKKMEQRLFEYEEKEHVKGADLVLHSGCSLVSLFPSTVIPCQIFEPFLQKMDEQWHQLASTDVFEPKTLQRLHGGPPPSPLSLAAYKNKIENLYTIYNTIMEKEKEQYKSAEEKQNKIVEIITQELIEESDMSRMLKEKEELFDTQKEDGGSLSVEELIKKHREMQEELTADILLMVSALKETSLQSLNIVREDIARLEVVDDEVTANIVTIIDEHSELKKQQQKAKLVTSSLYSLLFVVLVSFFVLYYFIRITSGRIIL